MERPSPSRHDPSSAKLLLTGIRIIFLLPLIVVFVVGYIDWIVDVGLSSEVFGWREEWDYIVLPIFLVVNVNPMDLLVD